METREIRLGILLTVGERQIEVPISVPVSLELLADLVQRHLDQGEDLYGALLEHYAAQVGQKAPKAPARGGGQKRKTDAPPAEKNGAGKQAPPAHPFSEAELAEWRGKLAPPWTGRGKKSRERQLWEAANPQQDG